jgi:hypothetical protein
MSLLTVALLGFALMAATPAIAQQAPTLGAPDTQTEVAPVETSTAADGGGLRPWQEILIVAAGLILVGGIAFAILGDARERAAQLRGHGRGESADTAGVRHRHSQRAKQRARAKARAAKAQRRRNRAR